MPSTVTDLRDCRENSTTRLKISRETWDGHKLKSVAHKVSDHYCLHHDKLVPELARIYVRNRDRELQKRVVVGHTASETDPFYEQHWKRQSKLCTLQDTKPGVLFSSKRLQTCESPGKSHARSKGGRKKNFSWNQSTSFGLHRPQNVTNRTLPQTCKQKASHTPWQEEIRGKPVILSVNSPVANLLSSDGDLDSTSSLPLDTLYSHSCTSSNLQIFL